MRIGAHVVHEEAHVEISGRVGQRVVGAVAAEVEGERARLGGDAPGNLVERALSAGDEHGVDAAVAEETGHRRADAVRCARDHGPGPVAFGEVHGPGP